MMENFTVFQKQQKTSVFIYNKEHMGKAPETFDEVFEFSKDFTQGETIRSPFFCFVG